MIQSVSCFGSHISEAVLYIPEYKTVPQMYLEDVKEFQYWFSVIKHLTSLGIKEYSGILWSYTYI
jgi:hypothetical protein